MARTRTRNTNHKQVAGQARARGDIENRVERQPINPGAQRQEYGGFNFGAAFFGWLSATALATILTTLATAGGASLALTRIEQNAGAVEGIKTIGIVGGILLLAILALAYFAGGYVAGRMSRFNGTAQGVGVWVMGVVITLALALAGSWFGSSYNVFQQMNLPRVPVDEGTLTAGGLLALLIAVAVTLGAAILGGRTGERYHHKVDRAGLAR